jgi:hypothetical protein
LLNLDFFDLLYADSEFCGQLGRVTLAASRLESNVREYLRVRGIPLGKRDRTLGQLTAMLENHGMISENGVRILRGLKKQRNYLTHSLFDLFAERIDETLLPRAAILRGDVSTFAEKAWELEQNLIGLAALVEEQIRAVTADDGKRNELLFRP